MINLDDRIFEDVKKPEHMWLLLHIARRIGKNRDCWPKNFTLAKDCNWSENTVQKYKKQLKELGLLTIEKRFVNNKQAANSYLVNTPDIKLYIPINQIPTQDVGTQDVGTQSVGTQDLGNRSINKIEVLINKNNSYIGQIKDLHREREELKSQLRELTEKQPKPKRKRFSPPTIEQITEHFKEKGSGKNEAEKFFNFYESNGWKVGKNKMANWKAAATNWVKRNVPTAQTSPEQQTADTYTLPPKLEAQYEKGKKAFEKKHLSQRIAYFNKQEFEGWMEKGKNFERWRDRGLLARQIYKKITDTILYFDTNSFVKNSSGSLQDFVTSAFEGKIKEL